MNPTFSARLSQAVVQPAVAFNAPAAPPNTSSAARRQIFVDTISEAIGGASLRDAELTALLREVDRLVQHWPDEVRCLGLAEDLSPAVRQMLTAAVDRAGLTVIEHQPSSCSFHVHATEMKRPPAEDADDVVGPDVHLAVHVPHAQTVPSGTPRENIDVIERVLNLHCSGARAQGGANGYRQASRTRDAVLTAVMEGATSVELDLPGGVATELEQLGLTCRPSAPVEPVRQLIDAMQTGDAAAVTAALTQLKEANRTVPGSGRLIRTLCGNAVLVNALAGGHAAAVTAFFDALRYSLGPSELEALVLDSNPKFNPLQFAMARGHAAAVTAFIDALIRLRFGSISKALSPGVGQAMSNGHAAAVTAFMDGLQRARLQKTQIHELLLGELSVVRFFGSQVVGALGAALEGGHAAAVTAYMIGLKGSGLSQEAIVGIVSDPEGSSLGIAMCHGPADVVKAYMDGLKLCGLTPPQITDILRPKTTNFSAMETGIFGNDPATVTVLMEGLQAVGFTPDQVYRVVCPSGGLRIKPTASWQAYCDGLKFLAGKKLISAKQLMELQAQAMSITEPTASKGFWFG